MKVKIQSNNWVIWGGGMVVLNNGERDIYLKEGLIRHKEGSENGEMEFTEKYFNYPIYAFKEIIILFIVVYHPYWHYFC
jgi:hypothetical protein